MLATLGTKRCISCSTLAECELFAKAGFDDILFTRIFSEDRLPRMKSLLKDVPYFHVMIDSRYCLDLLLKNKIASKPWSIFLKIDTGDMRGENGFVLQFLVCYIQLNRFSYLCCETCWACVYCSFKLLHLSAPCAYYFKCVMHNMI